MAEAFAAEIYRKLPARNCGVDSPCGNSMCVQFAKKLLSNENEVEDCPYLDEEHLEAIVILLEDYFNRR